MFECFCEGSCSSFRRSCSWFCLCNYRWNCLWRGTDHIVSSWKGAMRLMCMPRVPNTFGSDERQLLRLATYMLHIFIERTILEPRSIHRILRTPTGFHQNVSKTHRIHRLVVVKRPKGVRCPAPFSFYFFFCISVRSYVFLLVLDNLYVFIINFVNWSLVMGRILHQLIWSYCTISTGAGVCPSVEWYKQRLTLPLLVLFPCMFLSVVGQPGQIQNLPLLLIRISSSLCCLLSSTMW